MPPPSKEADPDRTRLLRAWAEVDLAALSRNAEHLRSKTPQGALLAVVKANAYGHGIGPIAQALRGQVWGYGVATLAEAERLTACLGDAAPRPPILLLSPLLPLEREAAVRLDLSVTVSNPDEVEAFECLAATSGRPLSVHAVVDTGMGRMGCLPDGAPDLLEAVAHAPHLKLEGFATHFPSADCDLRFTRQQIHTYRELLDAGKKAGQLPASMRLHLGNSAALLQLSEELEFATLHRPGLALYGASPLPGSTPELAPALSLRARVTQVRTLPAGHGISYGRTYITERPTCVATLAIGYGDGYPRHLSGRGAEVLLRGQRCPLLGVVTMDQIMIDAGPALEAGGGSPVEAGEVATLMGSDGDQRVTAEELADRSGTIPWEVFTGLTERVPRIYLDT